jgi:uncharacterized protein (DUF433 family)
MVVAYAHIAFTEDGVPVVDGTATKVIEIALDQIAYGWDVEAIQRQHPGLTLGQVHGALAYFYDHQAELEQDIARRLAKVDSLAGQVGRSSLRARLLARRATA